MRMTRIACAGLAALLLTGCGAGERLNSLNPFRGEETDDPNAPAQDQRVSILAFEEGLSAPEDVVPIFLPPAYVNDRWSQPDGYPTHAVQHTQASGPLARLWRADAGAGSGRDQRLNTRPVMADGSLYTLDAAGRVTAFDAETGREQWRVRLDPPEEAAEGGGRFLGVVPVPGGGSRGGSFGGGLAIDGGLVFAHAGHGYVVALDASTGDEVWRQTAFTPFHTAPTVADGRVFLSTDDNELFALDARDGEVLWTHRGIAETARLLTAPSVAVLGEVVIAPYTSGEIVALRAQNGSELWSDSLTRAGGLTPLASINDIAASPVVIDNAVYAVSHSGIMGAFDLRTGERLWTQNVSGLHTPWVAGDFLFLITSDAEVVAMERTTGDVRWITQLSAFQNERRRTDRIAWAGPILAGGRLILASSEGRMVILDPSDGSIMEERRLDDPVFVPPIIANETVYVLTDDARVIALR